MIRIETVRGLVLQTPNFADCVRFYGAVWGLCQLPDGSPDRGFFAGRGTEPWILGIEPSATPAMGPLRLGLGSTELVDAAARTLSSLGVAVDGPPRLLNWPGSYYGFFFTDPDGRRTEISAIKDPSAQARHVDARPERVSHIVVNSTNARRMAEFYVDVLGFAMSDWYERDHIIFLRCSADHHSLGFSQAQTRSLNHVAFLVDDLEAIMRAMGSVKRAAGAEPIWGPGRHGPGGNVFAYFEDPAGFVTEYTAELIQINEPGDWRPKEWQRSPEHANVWGTGGPTSRAIALMAGGQQVDSRATAAPGSASTDQAREK